MRKKRQWTRLAFVGFAVILVGTLRGCSSPVNPWAAAPGSPRVLVSFAPLYCFAKNVAGDGVAVLPLTTAEGPHEFADPTPADFIKVRKADLYLVNGLELENDKVVNGLKNSSGNARLKIIAVGEVVPEAKRLHLGEHGHEHAKGEKHQEGHYDPHVWLGVPEAKQMVEKIRDELTRLDEKRAGQYAANAKAYLARLDDLEKYGKEQLGAKKIRVIAMHDSMGYFARSFPIEVIDTIQANPGEDPDGRKMQELIKLAAEKQVNAVCYEKDSKKDRAETLLEGLKKKGVTATLVEFDPLETAEPSQLLDNPRWYEERMRANIDNLAKALK